MKHEFDEVPKMEEYKNPKHHAVFLRMSDRDIDNIAVLCNWFNTCGNASSAVRQAVERVANEARAKGGKKKRI